MGGLLQVTFVPTQEPAWQESPVVQPLLSSQLPLFLTGFVHAPLVQTPTEWHSSKATHVFSVPAHTPWLQVSLSVHALLSLQVPLFLTGLVHVPPVQTPAEWHWSEAAHVFGVPAHTPWLQVSLSVHASPSLQLPLFFAMLTHVPVVGLQVPSV
jgi:uncharacterized protein YaiE (UPF0345 family)